MMRATLLFYGVFVHVSFGQNTPSPTKQPTFDSHPADIQAILDNFQCFEDKKVNYFVNDPQTELYPDVLPQVRILMGGWESQYALNFAAALFMKEKLGMNVTFWPTVDPDIVWEGQFWDNWNGSNAFPRNYFAWLADDKMDLNFEFWETHIHRFDRTTGVRIIDAEKEFFLEGTVDFGGSVGPYAEESLWVPQYTVDEYPDFILPESIRDNDMYRQLLINASRGIGGNCAHVALNLLWGDCTDWTAAYKYSGNNLYDEPDDERPIVWGSGAAYYMSTYAHDLLNTYPVDANNVNNSGINVSFVTTSWANEFDLWNIVSEMYKRRLPFVANLYTIDINFGTIDGLDGELQSFVKMAYPQNHDQSVDDICFEETRCQPPISPIYKAANPLYVFHSFLRNKIQKFLYLARLEQRLPEAFEFYRAFSVPTSQLNLLMSKYMSRRGGVPSWSQELGWWLNATCDWIKDSASFSTWNRSSWYVDIERYNCLEGCGVIADDGNYYGGSCDYHTGNCTCEDGYIGDNCATSLHPTHPAGSPSYCYSHSDCDSPTAPFCYSYANYHDVDYGYCTSCEYCLYCSYGIDGECGDACDQTTHFGAYCNAESESSGQTSYGTGYPSADDCDWVEVSENKHDWSLSTDSTMDECIELAWNSGCQSAKWHNGGVNGNKACYCGYYGDEFEMVQVGSEYQACFLDDYRNFGNMTITTWIKNFFATAGVAVLALCICGPLIFCLCACIGIYCCCCRKRSNNNVKPTAMQQATKIMVLPEQSQRLVPI